MRSRAAFMFIAALSLLVSPLYTTPAGGVEGSIPSEPSRQYATGAELVLDRIVEVPPGGETRLVLPNGSDPYLEGYIGPSSFTYGKLGQAADLLPDWLKDDFVRNMLDAGSYDLSVMRAQSPSDAFRFNFIPSFGDLDGDGDEDMVVGLDGSLYFYENVGTPGYPVFVEGHQETIFQRISQGHQWISPEICDIDGDPYLDLMYGGEDGYIYFVQNPIKDEGQLAHGFSINMEGPFEDHLSPTIIKKNKDNITLLIGCKNGRLYQWDFEISFQNGHIGISWDLPKTLVTMKTLNYSAPRSWLSSKSDIEELSHLLALGSGEGTLLNYQVDWPISGGDPLFTPIPNYFDNIDRQGPITPAPFDLDGDISPDLVLGSRDPYIPMYVNYHSENMNPPYWAPSTTIIKPSPMENYLSVFDRKVMIYDESQIERYLDSIISPTDPRYRDEIGFACAYTPPEMLSGNRIANILNDNAYYIYSRESELEYVSLKEYGGDDYYTTASYWVDVGGTLKQMEIPMDAYYWGIVHPRITEEPVAYVDPESGGEELPENGGRFWREYIYEHADESYPPGPEYPSDHTGRYVYYPRDFSPPLLKDELKGIEVLWDLQPYEYPAGFNDAGTEFNYPVGHKVHAIERVSQWVERTLPLNQQESRDNERPNQPVRIAHHHNGNCGELQDLTIAAARCALIPARGVNLPGEDHVWSEFYCGGWQQWDNYWSDGGGVVANDMTYWWGWGNRGGSGIYASMGTGETVDVGERYRSPEVQGKLTVIVRSGNGVPVDGARVVLLSHWMMNNMNVDVGPYQGPPPVTVPFPSILGYTDDTGKCTLTAWQQEFNLKVTSEMGQFLSDKFTITSDEQTLEVELQGHMPIYSSGMTDIGPPESGSKYLISAEVLGSYQDQTQFLTGELFRESMDMGSLVVELNMNDGNTYPSSIFSRIISERDPLLLPLESGAQGSVLKIKKWGGIKTSVLVRLKVFEVTDLGENRETMVVVANPTGKEDKGFINGDGTGAYYVPELVLGWVLDPKANISQGDYSVITENGNRVVLSELFPTWDPEYWRYDWVIGWWESDLITELDIGSRSVRFEERSSENVQRTIGRSDILVTDIDRPTWETSVWERTYPWGSKISFGAVLLDPQSVYGLGWIDSKYLWTVGPSEEFFYRAIEGSVDSSKFGPGGHQLRLSVLDRSDNLRTFSFPTSFVPNAPILNITSPTPGYRLTDDQLVVRAQASDDVELISLTADVNGTRWDLFRYLDSNGFLETVLDLDEVPGPLTLTITATDNVGLTTRSSVNFTLLSPPDTTPPAVEITDPSSGKRVTIGDILTVRGRALDDTGIAQLKLQASGTIIDLLPDLKGTSWSVLLDTSEWPEGSVQIIARAVDPKGNIGTDKVTITTVLDTSEPRDRTEPVITVHTPSVSEPVELGTIVTMTGMVEDDGIIDRFEISMDRGDSFDDHTSSLGEDGSFSVRLDTSVLPGLLYLTPMNARSVLDDFSIVLMARDGAGRTTYLGHRLSLEDTMAPDASLEGIGYGDTDGPTKVSFDIRIKDGSAPGAATVMVLDVRGRTVSTWEIATKEFVVKDGHWGASSSHEVSLDDGEYELKVIARDVYGNSATVVRSFSAENERVDESVPLSVYLVAGSVVLIVIAAASALLAFVASNMEKRRKKSIPDGEESPKV